jgi:hypothetical protein
VGLAAVADRRLLAACIPERLQDQYGYPPLTEKAKRRILGLNAARLYKKPLRQPRLISGDQLAEAQDEQGGAHAGRRLVTYGPRTRREFLHAASRAAPRADGLKRRASSLSVPGAARAAIGIRVAA